MQIKNIKILPQKIANRIAAGEVVQRPASVVKELMENSIDAGASNIDVFVKQAGKMLLQVIDDGSGMSDENLKLSIKRHATSKISTAEDLDSINTFGFRGEALSSISAVAQIEIKTEMDNDELGTRLKISDDDDIILEKGSFSKGTSVSVKNLFYNTPARRNFLKSNSTELKHVIDIFKKIALSYPSISFKFWNDDDVIFDFQRGDIDARMKSIFADNILDGVVKVKEDTEFLSLNGYVAKPKYLSKSKGEQYLFINNRFVSSRMINHSVFSAYENILEKGDYPFFVLFLTIDPHKVDVNVHPSKLEVKFEREKDIYTFVNVIVKKSLGATDLVPEVVFRENNPEGNKLKLNFNTSSKQNDFSDRPIPVNNNFKNESSSGQLTSNELDKLFDSLSENIRKVAPDVMSEHPFQSQSKNDKSQTTNEFIHTSEKTDSKFIVLLHNKYILTQIKSGLMIIDSHVAHERILYEKALKSMNSDLPFSQQLLFAQTIKVDPADYMLIKDIEKYLNQLGFQIKYFGNNTIVIDGVPSDLKVGTESDTLLNLIAEYRIHEKEEGLEIIDNIAKSYSCKAAIKAGDKLSEQEMRILVDQLFATEMPYVCPHGRPIIVKIPLTEFDKRFGRT